jgi:hypothetical protein
LCSAPTLRLPGNAPNSGKKSGQRIYACGISGLLAEQCFLTQMFDFWLSRNNLREANIVRRVAKAETNIA